MTLKRILTFDVNRILQFDVNRVLRWDVGAALSRPITNPVLKFAFGWFVGIMVFGLGLAAVGITPTDRRIRMLAMTLGVAFAMTPNVPSLPPREAEVEHTAVRNSTRD